MLRTFLFYTFILLILLPLFSKDGQCSEEEGAPPLSPVSQPAPPGEGSVGEPPYLFEVTIYAPRDLLEAGERVSPLDRIPGEEVRAAPSLGKGLERSPAVLSRAYSGRGSLESLQLRGLPADGTLILLDGVPLRFPLSGAPNLSSLPALALEEVKILRGGGSHLFGGNAMGGIVALDTTPRSSRKELRLEAGSYGALSSELLLSRAQSAWGALSLLRAQEDYPYPSGERRGSHCAFLCLIRTDTYGEGVRIERRENNGIFQGKGLVGVKGALSPGIEGEVRFYGQRARKEVPGSVATPTPLGYEEDENLRGMGRIEGQLGEGNPFELSLAWDEERIRYADALFVPLREPSLSRARSLGLYLHSMQTLTGALRTFLYGERRYEEGSLPGGGRPRRHLWALGGMLQYAPGLWGLQGSTRVDGVLGREPVVLPSLGGFFTLHPLTLKGEVHAGYRDPTFNELYWPRQAGAEGNPELKPVRSRGGGVEIEFKEELFAVSVAGYEERVRDLILWQPQAGVWRPENLGKVRSRGAELSGNLSFPLPLLPRTHLILSAHYAYRLAENEDERLREDLELLRTRGRSTCPRAEGFPQVPLVPLHQGGGEVRLKGESVEGGFNLRALGERATGAENTTCLPPLATLGGFLQYSFKGTLDYQVRLSADNLLNQYNEEIPGYPAPPRTVWFTATVSL